MTDQNTCTDCGQAMAIGFMPTLTEGMEVQGKWHPGVPEFATLFGSKTGRIKNVQYDQVRAVTAFCCTGCGVLKFYAHPRQE